MLNTIQNTIIIKSNQVLTSIFLLSFQKLLLIFMPVLRIWWVVFSKSKVRPPCTSLSIKLNCLTTFVDVQNKGSNSFWNRTGNSYNLLDQATEKKKKKEKKNAGGGGWGWGGWGYFFFNFFFRLRGMIFFLYFFYTKFHNKDIFLNIYFQNIGTSRSISLKFKNCISKI